MDYTVIDAHAHLWLRQDTVVDGLPIRTLENGRSEFMGEIRQMVPPFMIDGVNSFIHLFIRNSPLYSYNKKNRATKYHYFTALFFC